MAASAAGELLVAITPDTRNFASQVERQTTAAGDKAGRSTGASMVAGLAAKVGGVVAIGSTIGLGFRTAMDNEVAQIKFTQLLGSTEAAKGYIEDLQAFAAKTPFDFPGIQEAAGRFLAVGTEADRVIPIMTTLGDATAMMGTGAAGVDRATTALTQMAQKGKVTGEEMMQLTEAGVPAWDALSSSMGVPVTKAQEMVSKGLVPADKMFEALETSSGDSLQSMAGGMDKMSETFSGQWSTLKDTAQQTLGKLFVPLVAAGSVALDWINNSLVPMLEAVPAFIDKWSTPLSVVAGVILTVMLPALILWAGQAAISAAAQVVAFASTVGSAVAAGITYAITAAAIVASWIASAAAAMVNAAIMAAAWLIALGPIGLIIAAIVAVVGIFVLLWNKLDGFKEFWIGVWDLIWGAIEPVIDWLVDTAWPLVQSVFDNIMKIVGMVWDAFKLYLGLVLAIWIAVFTGIWNVVKWAFDLVWGFIKDVVGWIVDKVKWGIELVLKVWDGIKAIWTWVSDIFGKVWTFIKEKVTAIWDVIWDKIEPVVTFFKDTFTNVYNTVKEWLGKVVTFVSDKVEAIIGFFTGIGSKLIDAGADAIRGLWDGIQSMIGWIKDKILGFVKDMLPDFVEDALGISSPSKVFAGIGKQITLGLAEGIVAEEGAVLEAMAQITPADVTAPSVNAAANSFDAAAAGAGAPLVQVFIGDEQLDDFIVKVGRREFEQTATRLLSGVGGGYR